MVKKGSFVKDRTDVQEEQLKTKMSPINIGFGLELEGFEGVLTTIQKGEKKTEKLKAETSSYLKFFDAVFDSITTNKEFIVSREQIVKQIEILED